MSYGALLPRLRTITDALPAVEVDNAVDGLGTAARAFGFIKTTLGIST